MNGPGIILTLVLCIMLLSVPRPLACLPLFLAATYVTYGQKIMVGGLDLTVVRILVTVGWVRAFIRSEAYGFGFNRMDRAVVLWTISGIVMNTLLWRTTGAFTNRLGAAYNSLGLYFLFRFFIWELDDAVRVFEYLAVLIVPLALLMTFESFTGRNLFGQIFGGVPLYSMVRYGDVRAMGPFRHPILAGTFGATLMPFMVALWFQEPARKALAVIGFVACSLIVMDCGSSGALLAYLFVGVALVTWFLRFQMKAIRRGIVMTLLALEIAMKAPIWYLIARVSTITGGTGWHRSYLIDQAFSHISEWWLMGTKQTSHWMARSLAIDDNKADITNQYIAEGVKGGLLTMGLFIFVLVRAFQGVGQALGFARDQPLPSRFMLWCMGASLFGHSASFISVSYFDQIIVAWFFLLAFISSMSNGPFVAKEHSDAVAAQ